MKKVLPIMLAVLCVLTAISVPTAFAADDLSTNIILTVEETDNTLSSAPDTMQVYQNTQPIKQAAENINELTGTSEKENSDAITSFIQTSGTISIYILILVGIMCMMLVILRTNKSKTKNNL